MTEMNLIQAVVHTLDHEMERDENMIVLGEDVGKNGGVLRSTAGLYDKYGGDRVLDTPLNESTIIGSAIGMALYGMTACAEIQFQDFLYPGFDQLVNEAAKFRYRSGGEYNVPMVVRTPYGGGIRGGHYHSQSGETHFAHTSGLKVVVPSNPYDLKGLLLSSLRDPDPVIFMEPKRIYRAVKNDVPEEDYTVPLGKANLVREGEDVSIITFGSMVPVALSAAKAAEEDDISVEVLDLRTLNPMDEEAVLKTARKTGRVVSFCEAPRHVSFASEVSATIAEKAIDSMEAPIVRVTGYDTPFPYTLESLYLPDANRVYDAIEKVYNYR
ncbi:MAG: alpha-ketoacid dehydrogenase subunit beta [Euryarchaeota archaeon]|nr:alpha-ketoacid dehydrogenase subunit beta [Euryarchaeota archaeon]